MQRVVFSRVENIFVFSFAFPSLYPIELDRKKIISDANSRDTSRLIVQLQETEQKFDQFYEEHSMELKQCLELRRFECDFRDLQVRKRNLVKLELNLII